MAKTINLNQSKQTMPLQLLVKLSLKKQIKKMKILHNKSIVCGITNNHDYSQK